MLEKEERSIEVMKWKSGQLFKSLVWAKSLNCARFDCFLRTVERQSSVSVYTMKTTLVAALIAFYSSAFKS